ncbi:hypothetical protein MPSEU_000913500 [Mayamaea pseudoterrestris]|nr:hypothetical protein MPSEU_000913500 [Mayamaea pseudoterrestris]
MANRGSRHDDDASIEAPYVSINVQDGSGYTYNNQYENPTVPPVMDMSSDETDDDEDNHSISSVLTAEGIHDIVGFYCVCLVILIGDMSRGVMFPSMWPLVESLGGDQVLLGYAVAAFSFGRVLVNPLFGAWSHQFGYTKTLVLSTTILLFGTLTYTQIQTVGRPEFLIVSQTILGIGSGTLGVTRAFVADVTAKRQRTVYMGLITAVQYGGFTVTPIFGALFNYLFQDDDYRIPFLPFISFNKFTMPAIFMATIVAFTLFILLTYFKDRHRITTLKEAKKPSLKRQAIDEVANAPTCLCLTVYDCCILGCMLLNVSTKGSIAAFETLGIAIAEAQFGMVSSRAGFIVALCGSLGVVSLLNMDKLALFLTDLQMIMGGMIVMCIGILSLGLAGDSQWIYVFAMLMIYSIGYPVGHTAVIGLFSKIVGRRPQGTLLGYFASAGSVARMLFPVMSGYIARYSAVDTLFWVLMVVLLVSTAFVAVYRNILSLLSS